MKVELLHITPLWLCANAIRMSHDNHHLSDSYMINPDKVSCMQCGGSKLTETVYPNYIICDTCSEVYDKNYHIGKKDLELIHRVGNKLKHKSVLEQIIMFWEIDGISRACLQQLVRHRTARLVVQSTRYTLGKLKKEPPLEYHSAKKFLVYVSKEHIDKYSVIALQNVQNLVKDGGSNDEIKMCLPESFKTRLQWQIDMRNFQNFYQLRSAKDAHWEIRELANKLYESLPKEYQKLVLEE